MQGHKDERTRDELQALGYEKADVGLRVIAIMVFWFFAFAAGAGVVTAGIYHVLVPGGVMPPKVAPRDRFPHEPRLQDEITVKTDIYQLREAEAKELNGSGPSTHNKGAYHIPIDLAIKKWAAKNGGGDTRIILSDVPAGGIDNAPTDSGGAQSPAGGGH